MSRRVPPPDPALVRGIHEKIAACPELGGDILGWALTVGSGACAIGMSGALLDYAPVAGASPCPHGLCDGSGVIVTYPEPTRICSTSCPCSPPVCPFNECDGSGAIETRPAQGIGGPDPEPAEGCVCRCQDRLDDEGEFTRRYFTPPPWPAPDPEPAPPTPDPWELAPPGLNPDEDPLQLPPDPLDDPDPAPEETPW